MFLAGADGEVIHFKSKKNEPSEIKDCFENLNMKSYFCKVSIKHWMEFIFKPVLQQDVYRKFLHQLLFKK